MTQQPASWAVLNTTSIINRLMQWKQKLIICHSQSEISTNSWKCLACNRFVECLTGSFPFWSLSKFCRSWSCKEAMQRCCFAHLKDLRELPTDVISFCGSLQGFKVSRLGPMSWSVEWPSVSASRSHLGPKAMSRQNGTKSPGVGYQFSHETEVKKETKGLIYSISNLYRNWTESVLFFGALSFYMMLTSTFMNLTGW